MRREKRVKKYYRRYCIRLFSGIKGKHESSRQIMDSEVLENEEKWLSFMIPSSETNYI